MHVMKCLVSAAVWAFMDILSSDVLESHETNIPNALTIIELQLIAIRAEPKGKQDKVPLKSFRFSVPRSIK